MEQYNGINGEWEFVLILVLMDFESVYSFCLSQQIGYEYDQIYIGRES